MGGEREELGTEIAEVSHLREGAQRSAGTFRLIPFEAAARQVACTWNNNAQGLPLKYEEVLRVLPLAQGYRPTSGQQPPR